MSSLRGARATAPSRASSCAGAHPPLLTLCVRLHGVARWAPVRCTLAKPTRRSSRSTACRTVREVLFGANDRAACASAESRKVFTAVPKTPARTCRSVRELLFGYQDELLERLAALLPSLRDKAFVSMLPNMTSRATALAIPRNVMATGVRGAAATWRYVRWQGLDDITCWHNHTEHVAGGSDALEFDAGLAPNGSVHVFVPELYRTAKLNVTGTVRARGY